MFATQNHGMSLAPVATDPPTIQIIYETRCISYYANADFAIRWDNLNRCTKMKKNGR